MPEIDWIFNLKKGVPRFLEKLKSKNRPGFFHYSLTGDLFSEDQRWGLGQTVFAIKIYYTLNLLNDLPGNKKLEMINFINSFQDKKGNISDSLIIKKGKWRNLLYSLKNFDFNNVSSQQIKRAEARQALSALNLIGAKPKIIYQDFPKTKEKIEKYLTGLNWTKPWGAGSYFSHLLFFLKQSDLENKEELINKTLLWISKLQNQEDGSWYKGQPAPREKINGAMKIITGLKIVNQINFLHPEKLIDLCLSEINNKHACDNFNIIYVLKYAWMSTGKKYKTAKIKKFATERLEIYKKYYYPKIGGFSFRPEGANIYYYGARITKGFKEPDIHGTVMFLWGISLIAQILEIEDELGFKEFNT